MTMFRLIRRHPWLTVTVMPYMCGTMGLMWLPIMEPGSPASKVPFWGWQIVGVGCLVYTMLLLLALMQYLREYDVVRVRFKIRTGEDI